MIYPEINSVFHVKIMICFILDRISKPVSEEQLYEIVHLSEVINYFYYAEALEELIQNGSASRVDGNIILNEKGRLGSEYFNSYIPEYFHNRLLKSAYSLFSRVARESETDISVNKVPNGFEVNCAIKDVSYDLMRVSLYAPDIEQANLIKNKILKNPAVFYRNVIEYALENEENKENF
ncbi:MAG: DUF4364 family protein [Oscillospiraceae bacterium]|nr:DUF4364 family protein [Oscillospiraceae bacterium]